MVPPPKSDPEDDADDSTGGSPLMKPSMTSSPTSLAKAAPVEKTGRATCPMCPTSSPSCSSPNTWPRPAASMSMTSPRKNSRPATRSSAPPSPTPKTTTSPPSRNRCSRVGADTSRGEPRRRQKPPSAASPAASTRPEPRLCEEAKELWDLLALAKDAPRPRRHRGSRTPLERPQRRALKPADEPRLRSFDSRVSDELGDLRNTVRVASTTPLGPRGEDLPATYCETVRREAEDELHKLRAEKRRLESTIARFRRPSKKLPKATKRHQKRSSPRTAPHPEFDF